MSSEKTTEEKAKASAQRRRVMKYGAAAGMLLGLVCHVLPPKYQTACNAVSQVAAISCGGGGAH